MNKTIKSSQSKPCQTGCNGNTKKGHTGKDWSKLRQHCIKRTASQYSDQLESGAEGKK